MGWPVVLSREIDQIRERFFNDPKEFRPEQALSQLLDTAVLDGWKDFPSGPDFAVMAVGGYGRETLHPQSDLDLLVFFSSDVVEETVRRLLMPVWDLGFRVGHQVRQATDFDDFQPDQMESYTAFLDARFLFGDPQVVQRFITETLPDLIKRNQDQFLDALVDMKRRRYRDHGHTVFQLEPDIKTAPGGLRDHQWIRWVSHVLGLRSDPAIDAVVLRLFRFRNFLHFMSGRDHNILSYEYQEQIATKLGYTDSAHGMAPEHLMRDYFLSAQAVAARVRTLETQITGPPKHLPVPQPIDNISGCFSAFREAHRTKLALDPDTLGAIRRCVQTARPSEMSTQENAQLILELMQDRQGIAGLLRTMHEVGLLGGVFPEFEEIRCRVIRDYFHKYTVDEHSLIAIGNIEALDGPNLDSSLRGLSRVVTELEHPQLLLLALLLHDIGKASRHVEGNHACSSVEMLQLVLGRLGLPTLQAQRIQKVVQNHLEMSKIVMRRDLGDPTIVETFADLVGTQEDLRMLYLLTYADMKAVSPDVWTSWKADLLWQLYLTTFEYLRHGFVEDRVRPEESGGEIATIESLLDASVRSSDYREFLDGFPKQYLRSTPPERVAGLIKKYVELSPAAPVVTDWSQSTELWDVIVMTEDRLELFSRITGTLASFGMNVVRADAFSNLKNVAVDLVTFEDPEQTLSKNPSELDRLDGVLKEVVTGAVSVDELLRRRSSSILHRRRPSSGRVHVVFDRSSSECTIVEIVASDDIGLLFNISKVVANLGCNIEVALIATEGQKAVDVFYLTRKGRPLTTEVESRLQEGLREVLEGATVSPGIHGH